ncbi:MAG TPA: nucleotidyl transferase AbiEii/AbiGii toxin family protein [Yinghuangia sp.]|nr:nucleotidyl transferase AbiEii/AbiGii toxin family protein [Yinghuangia sp.]
MTPDLHRQLIALGLEAGAAHGFALAGGYAVQAHHIVARLSDDVDLFTSWDRRDEVTAATDHIVSAYRQHGFHVVVADQTDSYVQLLVSPPHAADDPDAAVKIELVADIRLHEPVATELGLALHPDDVAAGKMSALFSRAAARDYIDVAALLSGDHYTREQLIDLATERDGGFDQDVFAQMLDGIHRYKDADFLRYGITPATLRQTRDQITHWHAQLTRNTRPAPGPSTPPQPPTANRPSRPAR